MHICIKAGIAATLIVLSPLLLGNALSGLSSGGQQVATPVLQSMSAAPSVPSPAHNIICCCMPCMLPGWQESAHVQDLTMGMMASKTLGARDGWRPAKGAGRLL